MNKFLFSVILLGGAAAQAKELKFPHVAVLRTHADYSFIQNNLSTDSFKFDAEARDGFQMDLRNCDLTGYDLAGNRQMQYASFNTLTKFPARLPPGFTPEKIMELGRNPGLGVRKLHKRGITGKGVGLGIIDQALLSTHAEYAARLKFYEEIHCLEDSASMHAQAVSSLAVGKTIGVAPGADLYVIGQTNGDRDEKGQFQFDLGYIARSIDRLVEVNKQLPEAAKIRVISISLAMVKKWKGYDLAAAAIKRAAENNIFVLTVGDEDFPMDGLGRAPLADPDKKESYTGGLMFCGNKQGSGPAEVQVPMDSRTLADPNGDNAYYFARVGGQSWTVPWMAGLYALACQVYPEVTPAIFWNAMLETADAVTFKKDGAAYTLQKVVNPEKLMARLRKLDNY
ncbi:MAG: hypothetical protein NDI60_00875 [Elusimicrobiales bacterium]|nr:hypothetical protein [Elusimicrobiales bacterium]